MLNRIQIPRKLAEFSFVVLCIFVFRLFSILRAVGLFRSDMLLIFHMVWSWFFCGTVCLSAVSLSPTWAYKLDALKEQFFFHKNQSYPCLAICYGRWITWKERSWKLGLPFDIVPVAIFWLQFLGSVLKSWFLYTQRKKAIRMICKRVDTRDRSSCS